MGVVEVLSIMLFFITLILVLYLKYKMFHIIIVVYLFGFLIGVLSFTEGYLPFTPYLQIFYLVFISVIFVFTAIDYHNHKK